MGIPKRGDPYGLGRFEAGHPDHTARAKMESNWPKAIPSIHPPSPHAVDYESQTVRSSGGGGGFILGLGRLIIGGSILLAVAGYFGSKSDSGSRHVPAGEEPTAKDSYPATPVKSAPVETAPAEASNATTDVQPTPASKILPASSSQADTSSPASSPRLVGNDERVVAAIHDVQAVSKEIFFLGKDGNVLVFQGHLNTPEDDIYQTSFDVANLDLYRTTYSTSNSNLNIPCKASAMCVSYALFDPSAQDTGGAPRARKLYGTIHMWSGSPEDAHRILQDLLQLQELER